MPQEAPHPAAHWAHIIFHTFHVKIFVPEIFGFVNGYQ